VPKDGDRRKGGEKGENAQVLFGIGPLAFRLGKREEKGGGREGWEKRDHCPAPKTCYRDIGGGEKKGAKGGRGVV